MLAATCVPNRVQVTRWHFFQASWDETDEWNELVLEAVTYLRPQLLSIMCVSADQRCIEGKI